MENWLYFDFVLFYIISHIKFFEHFTFCYILILFLHSYINVRENTLLICSNMIFNVFYFSSIRYNTLKRIYNKNNCKYVFMFMLYDIVAHLLPLMYNLTTSSYNTYINNLSLYRTYYWVFLYSVIIIKVPSEIECKYAKCCKTQGIYQIISTPIITQYVYNNFIQEKYYPLCAYILYMWYLNYYLQLKYRVRLNKKYCH